MRFAAFLLLISLAGCDLSTTLDIETPPYEAGAVIRSVLMADGVATVRLSVSRDPYVVDPAGEGLVARPSRTDGRVTLLRDGVEVETLTGSEQTCYQSSRSSCNVETGQVETTTEGPFACGSYRGGVRLEAGATYTVRAELPGLPSAEAAVSIPEAPEVSVEALPEADGLRRFRIRLADPPGLGHRYGLTILRELDQITVSQCRVGGAVDTLVVLDRARVYRSDFSSTDPVIVSGSREAGSSIHFVTFPDDAFDGRTRDFVIEATPRGTHPGDTGAIRVQVTAMTAELYDAYQITNFEVDENPFAEPADLPVNVLGGYGRVGAVAVTEVRFGE